METVRRQGSPLWAPHQEFRGIHAIFGVELSLGAAVVACLGDVEVDVRVGLAAVGLVRLVGGVVLLGGPARRGEGWCGQLQ